MSYIESLFAGAFLCNCIPHLVCGLRGEAFPTPFAKPNGVGESSPLVNFVWGFANLAVGTTLLSLSGAQLTPDPALWSVLAGALLMGIYLSLHFGKVRGKDRAR